MKKEHSQKLYKKAFDLLARAEEILDFIDQEMAKKEGVKKVA